jgi:uncharacterized protein (DUF1800 family)
MSMADRTDMAHLLRRATFGPTAAEVDAAQAQGLDATIAQLLAPTGVDPAVAATPLPSVGADPGAGITANSSLADRKAAQQARAAQAQTVINWWVARMVSAEHQFTEKLIFFWHGHWATSVQKVKSAAMMLAQLETLRRDGHGPFAMLLHSMLRDPALIYWLDGQQNTSKAPNENLARELMELFTLGIGAYTEDDVKQAARALTGWTIDRATLTAVFVPRRHDPGAKTILGQTATFDVDSFAALLLTQPAHPAHIAQRLWFRFASGEGIPAATQTRLIGAYGPAGDITAMLHALFTDEAFPASRGQLVKQPVEWLVGALRQLKLDPTALVDARRRQLLTGLDALGQLPLEPPSVGGWPAGAAWLTTSSAQTRMRLATVFATMADTSVLAGLTDGTEQAKLDGLARLLCVDAWTGRTAAALRLALGNPRQLLAIGLISPEYSIS